MITEEIKKLPARDRLILIEEIWDTLYEEADELDSPAWHRGVFDARREMIEKGEAEFIALDELKAKKQ
jgi:putative addiction module component (TIGR02574 family)